MKWNKCLLFLIGSLLIITNVTAQIKPAGTFSFNAGWKFFPGDAAAADPAFNDNTWRQLDLPHDWSIELPFDSTSPTGTGGGALRGGIGWYRKTFTVPASEKEKRVAILFDGVYRNSEVWINGHYLGKRPNGYISFQYELTPYVNFGNASNVIAVKVDNSQQPNSRWYSGSGIYRNVWLTITGKTHVAQWGTYLTTPEVTDKKATAHLRITVNLPAGKNQTVVAATTIYNSGGVEVAKLSSPLTPVQDTTVTLTQKFVINNPVLWSVDRPYLYKAVINIISNGKTVDQYTTPFGVRYFSFDADKGFFLNGKHVKITGVCNHHDLGCLGTAVNTRALERQLQILKGMGINGIRTSHNPPAPELLNLCDKMGFIVMDEAFDMWKQEKNRYDYHLDFDQWYKKDLEDQVVRDRNHPAVFMWSIGNEIQEQWKKGDDTSGAGILRDLHNIVKGLDDRPTVTANNETNPWNVLLHANVTDMIGYNYNHHRWSADSVQKTWGRKPFIITESASALQTRGSYDMPSDSIRRWPLRWDLPVEGANADLTCSAYENCSAPWGGTHIETLKHFLKNDNVSGMFIWTGFDYIGEPTPYPWPARSSYFGIVDLAGFPKDAYYLYQSVFTTNNVLHLFPHWNWKPGETIDMWAYYNNADEVELFINGKSQGVKRKTGDDLHVMWRVKYEPGNVKAVSRKNGKLVMTKEIRTAGAPAKIILTADRSNIKANGEDLSFVTVKIVDRDGNPVPNANDLIIFKIKGEGVIAGVDNGYQADLSSFKADNKKAFRGLALAVVQSNRKAGQIMLTATAAGLQGATIVINAK
ncbi:glycoside hydrolase [Niastella vici]|uniref:Glycoside hydrolase n=1 Tax=Niastella vici TaxID=1703345 RepID=A0A1V9FKU1_9BACT|nr:glycoside hydrolase family 2 TIM barrel-domain containing protein [Niastella vici]OQP58962.1 glycoside hydrolase [Niastella vici]